MKQRKNSLRFSVAMNRGLLSAELILFVVTMVGYLYHSIVYVRDQHSLLLFGHALIVSIARSI